MNHYRAAAALATLTLALSTSIAAGAGDDEGFFGKAPVSEEELGAMRGGFMSDDGLKISVGIDRSVMINNVLVDIASLRIPDLAAIRAGSPEAVQLTDAAAKLIQNGPGNFADPRLLQQSGPGMLTVIQNSLNNQLIQGRTVINIDVSGIRSMSAAAALSTLNAQLRTFR
ncbi:MAG TPA: hypothetical protein VFB54_00305 [Burkholderiales bacterium]|nr:hypothetical protein [Burkholderiales bacterium]